MRPTRPAGYHARSLRCSSLMGRNWLTHFAPRASRSDASLGRTRRRGRWRLVNDRSITIRAAPRSPARLHEQSGLTSENPAMGWFAWVRLVTIAAAVAISIPGQDSRAAVRPLDPG